MLFYTGNLDENTNSLPDRVDIDVAMDIINYYTLTSKIKLKKTIIKSVHARTLSWCKKSVLECLSYSLYT